MFIEWFGSSAPIVCPVCGWSGNALAAATFSDPLDVLYTARRCADCASLVIIDLPKDSSPDDKSIDHYLECGAGIHTILEELGRVNSAAVGSFLDVGCNYGFSLDFARSAYGWDVLGIEPSLSGIRGAKELGIEIVNDYLLESTNLGRTFDLILSSEVLEHVPDPVGFLRALKAQLSDGGTVLLTTPNAEVVSPHSSESDALIALSPGYHVFLVTAASLTSLLTRVGFGWVSVSQVGLSLRAMARVDASPPPTGEGMPHDVVERYYREVLDRSAEPSPLRLGMAARLLRSVVARGAFDDVDPLLSQLRDQVSSVYGIDIDSPETQLLAATGPTSGALPGIAFALGMRELLQRKNFRHAASYFELSGRAIENWLDSGGHPDLDLIDLREQSAYHRLLALAPIEPDAVVSGAVQLAQSSPLDRASAVGRLAARRARLFVELAAHDPKGDRSVLIALISPDVETLARSEVVEERVAARDALYVLGREAGRLGDSTQAHRWLRAAIAVCRPDAEGDVHARALLVLCEATLAQLNMADAASSRADRTGMPQRSLARRVITRARRVLSVKGRA